MVFDFSCYKVCLQINYDNVPRNAETQVFFAMGENYNEHDSYTVRIYENKAIFKIAPRYYFSHHIRIDPLTEEKKCSIREIAISGGNSTQYEIKGDALASAFKPINCTTKYDIQEKTLVLKPSNNDPILILSEAETGALKNAMIDNARQKIADDFWHYIIELLILVALCNLLYRALQTRGLLKQTKLLYENAPFLFLSIVFIIAYQFLYQYGAIFFPTTIDSSSPMMKFFNEKYSTYMDTLMFFLTTQAVFLLVIRNKIGLFLSYISYLLSMADFFNIKILKNHIDYMTLNSLDFTVIEQAKNVVPIYFWGVIALTFLYFFAIVFMRKKYDFTKIKGEQVIVCSCLVILAGIYSGTFLSYKNITLDYYKINKNQKLSIDECYHKLKGCESYRPVNAIQATPGKNIVIVYCESLETGYLKNEQLSKDMVNIKKIMEKDDNWSFYDNYNCLPGSTWTIGALYSTQTGLPTSFFGDGNKMFEKKNNYKTKLPSYGLILAKSGYDNLFLTGCSLDFAGTGNVMRGFGYRCMGVNSFTKTTETGRTTWGMHDYDLFVKAKEEYKKLLDGGSPFNLTLLTIDTHFPKGFPDKRMQQHIGIDADLETMDFSVASLDWLIYDFIEYIQNEDKLNNTAILILGDHLLFGTEDATPIVKQLQSGNRRIFLLSNKPLKNFSAHDEIGFYDIPNIVLDLAEVKTDAKLGKKLFPDMSPKFLDENMDLFTVLNLKVNDFAF